MRTAIIFVVLALILVCALTVGGWGGGGEKDAVVPLNEVPENLVRTAREKLPNVRFDHAVKKANGDYEVRGKEPNGQVREVEMKPTGEIVEIE